MYAELDSILEAIRSGYNMNELRNLCFMLDIDEENLPGYTLSKKMRSLVFHCILNNRYKELTDFVKLQRPKYNITFVPYPPNKNDI